jgi:hypothetical protein
MEDGVNETDNRIADAFARACVEGRFEADSYRPHPERPDDKSVVHLVQFTAYDGYHVLDYCASRKEADELVATVNGLHSVAAVNAGMEQRRDARKR